MAHQQQYPLSSHPNDGKSTYASRDLIGYGNPATSSRRPHVHWPNGAKVALNLVLNYEEGGENCLLHGDGESEKLLSEIVGAGAIGELVCVFFWVVCLFEKEMLVWLWLW
jgi:hypothetical protein